MENKKIENVINFYLLASSLKYKIRQGLLYWKVDSERLESIAEHVYGMCILAISIDSEYNFDINLDRILKMIVIHELEEVIIGDITPFDNISAEEKILIGRKATEKLLENLVKKEEYIILLEEFNNRETNDASFAYLCDKLECNIQMKYYEDIGCNSIKNQEDNPAFKNKKVNEIISSGVNTVAGVFLEYDKDKFKDNEIFKNIQQYITYYNLNK